MAPGLRAHDVRHKCSVSPRLAILSNASTTQLQHRPSCWPPRGAAMCTSGGGSGGSGGGGIGAPDAAPASSGPRAPAAPPSCGASPPGPSAPRAPVSGCAGAAGTAERECATSSAAPGPRASPAGPPLALPSGAGEPVTGVNMSSSENRSSGSGKLRAVQARVEYRYAACIRRFQHRDTAPSLLWRRKLGTAQAKTM